MACGWWFSSEKVTKRHSMSHVISEINVFILEWLGGRNI